MIQPEGHSFAERNLGILKYDWDDPRVQGFVDGLNPVNGAAMRSNRFVWMLPEEDMHLEQTDAAGNMGANPRTASPRSVWKSVMDLAHFVWNTVHKQFYDRKGEWYDMGAAMKRFHHLEQYRPSDHAFGWTYIKEAQLWRAKACG